MQRWFLSYHSPDRLLAERVKIAIERQSPDAGIFFAPASMRAGGFWTSQLAREIEMATAFVLLVADHGVGPWQVLEYGEALDRKVTRDDFPIVVLLQEGQTAPGLPFLRRLHWVVSADLASETSVAQLCDAVSSSGATTRELWRHTSPYRGLTAMEQKDSDYFFGRTKETLQVLQSLTNYPDKIPILLGNSGVGKSSIAQAGVLASLVRQSWPENVMDSWPVSFRNSRRWCFLSFRPGTEPIKSLVEAFLVTWQLDRTTTEWPERRAAWIDKILEGKLGLHDLIDQTSRRYLELEQTLPDAFFVYVNQAEELYLRSEFKQRCCFSRLFERGIADSRVHVLMSLRSDFLGELQGDEPLYTAHIQINVPPLREDQLLQVVSGPANLLSARFEIPALPFALAKRAADESIRDTGALPLLSYLLDEMWKEMIERGDGVLRLPVESLDLGRVLVERADHFIASNPDSEESLRRIFTLRLATVREDGEPTRRRASRSEFNDAEWRLVTQLAGDPYRLLSTFATETFEPQQRPDDPPSTSSFSRSTVYAEVAHEAIFRRWDKLRSWISSEREFLAWRTGLELLRRGWENAPASSKGEALLMGLALRQAVNWYSSRPKDIDAKDQEFVELSVRSLRTRRFRTVAMIGALAAVLSGAFAAWEYSKELSGAAFRLTRVSGKSTDQLLSLKPQEPFSDCSGCPQMVVVQPKPFFMGSPLGQGLAREHPQRPVSIKKPFAVSAHEITFKEWNLCVSLGDCNSRVGTGVSGPEEQPVVNISWNDARRYTDWLSRTTGKRYRLLSEAEWEYSARAGGQDLYCFGNDDDTFLSQYAWYDANSGGRPNPVGHRKPNAYGLYDMHGNVSEWVEDCYLNTYPAGDGDGSPWLSSNCGRRVIRGGSWRFGPFALRSAARESAGIDSVDDDRGMRVARDVID